MQRTLQLCSADDSHFLMAGEELRGLKKRFRAKSAALWLDLNLPRLPGKKCDAARAKLTRHGTGGVLSAKRRCGRQGASA